VAVGGLGVSLAGSRREDRAYDEGRADEREARSVVFIPDDQMITAPPLDPPGPAGPTVSAAEGAKPVNAHAGPGADEWEPEPGDRVYQWAHPHPIRATAPLTVIDWDALPWEERQLLTVWDWGRRMQAWVEDWDRDDLEGAAA